MSHIRKAEKQDIGRIAEILIFTKRMHYRSIFQNDKVSFGEMQVLSLANEYLEDLNKLDNVGVYDDEFVKGLIHVEGKRIAELFVEPFFQGKGIGKALIDFAIKEFDADNLWVLEKNESAIDFYKKHGFSLTEEKNPEEGTSEYIVRMRR